MIKGKHIIQMVTENIITAACNQETIEQTNIIWWFKSLMDKARLTFTGHSKETTQFSWVWSAVVLVYGDDYREVGNNYWRISTGSIGR